MCPKLSQVQIEKALNALFEFLKTKKGETRTFFKDDGERIRLVVSLKKPPSIHRNDKPQWLSLPHPMYSISRSKICLFVKDCRSKTCNKAKIAFEHMKKTYMIKIIGLSKLRKSYESFESKRRLCSSYDLFLSDDRIIPSLPKAIGKGIFNKKKKRPIPVRISNSKNWEQEICKGLSGTYLFLNRGTCVNVEVGRSNQTLENLVENVISVVEQVADLVPGKWSNVQGLFIRGAQSVALPIYYAPL